MFSTSPAKTFFYPLKVNPLQRFKAWSKTFITIAGLSPNLLDVSYIQGIVKFA